MTLASLMNCLQPPQGEVKCSHISLKEQKTLTLMLYIILRESSSKYGYKCYSAYIQPLEGLLNKEVYLAIAMALKSL